jgi:uncharacterized protein
MKKRVLVVSKGFIHPSAVCRAYLRRLLKALCGFSFVFSGTLKGLQRLGSEPFDAVILYYHEKKICDEALQALLHFAGGGGGVLALHSAMASFKTNQAYQELLGGRFTGHGKIDKIQVYSTDSQQLFLEKRAFSIKDELYIHEYDSHNEVILACDNQGREEPVLWTRGYGSGRVCYFAPGHMPNVFRSKEVKKVIQGALNWACRLEE